MYEPDKLMEKLIARATVEQRTVLGFPDTRTRLLDTPYPGRSQSTLCVLWHRYDTLS